jgi:integral membrane protein (TIGR01906 family)
MHSKNKKTITSFIIFLLILDTPLILYLFSFNNTVFDEGFYKKEFEEYKIYSRLAGYNIEKINSAVLNYLKHRDYELKDNFFNEREKAHLKDVKSLIQLILLLFYSSIFLFVVLLTSLAILNKSNQKTMSDTGTAFLFGGLLTFVVVFVFWLMTKASFNSVFDFMHKAFFEEGTYVFDPSFEKVVVLYPPELFYDIVLHIIATTLVFSLAVFLAGTIVVYFGKTKKYLNKRRKG